MARDFDGTDDYLNWSSVLDFQDTDFSLSFWVNFDVTTANQNLFVIANNASGLRSLWFRTDSGSSLRLTRDRSTSAKFRRTATFAIGTGVWEHWVATADHASTAQTSLRMYKNGTEVSYGSGSNGTGSDAAHDDDWRIGAKMNGADRLNGQLAEVGVWNRIITADEITALSQKFAPHLMMNGLVYYVDLIGRATEFDRISGGVATHTGSPIVAVHPPIIYPKSVHIAPVVAAPPAPVGPGIGAMFSLS